MSALISGLVAGALAFGLVSLAQRPLRPAAAAPDGWKVLRPSRLIDATIVGVGALAAAAGAFLLGGGSTLPDAAVQNGIAALFLAASGACALYTAWTAYGRSVMWKGDRLRVRTLSGRDSLRRISDVSRVGKNEMLGEYRITFRDGSTLRFSASMHGARGLAAKLPRRALRD